MSPLDERRLVSETGGSGPQRFGRYVVRRRIGSGGFATVWLAYDEQLDAPVAVKVLADNWTDEHQVRTRFIEEGRYLRRVESPHVVTVYDAGELPDGRPYLVMTYADQGTLADRLEAEALTVGQSLEVVRQVAAGLQALHDRGILHRDVKPANVLFRTGEVRAGAGDGEKGADEADQESGEVRVMLGDLGLGKALDVSSRLTMIAGSPAYVAPEQAQGEAPDARADQYSLAVLTYQLLSGRRPWDHATLPAAAHPTPPPPMSTSDRELPPAVEDVVARALSLDRSRRFGSVTAYVEGLTAALAGWEGLDGTAGTRLLPVDRNLTQPGARPSPWTAHGGLPEPVAPPRKRPVVRRLVIAAALLVALGAGVAGGYLGEQEADPEPSTAPVTLLDETGTLGVTVPHAWDADAAAEWRPPNARDQTFPALSVGTSDTWTDDGQGVFLGVLPGGELPHPVPQHKQCSSTSAEVQGTFQGFAAVTTFFADCAATDGGAGGADAAGGVIVERVVQIADNQLLWVQVRSADRAAATQVLDGVRLYGL